MYSPFAHEFSKTRTRPWPCVVAFLSSISKDKHPCLLDVGCGNGRNLAAAVEAGFIAEGFDLCPEFVDICRGRGLNVSIGNIDSPINPISKKYDAIMCIAVLHHLRTHTVRLRAVSSMYEALNPGGSLLVTVWSFENDGARFPKVFEIGDNDVSWRGTAHRYYYIYDKSTLDVFLDEFLLAHPCAEIATSWEEQNWNVKIKKPLK